MVYETKLPRQASASTVTEDFGEDSEVKNYKVWNSGKACAVQKLDDSRKNERGDMRGRNLLTM